MVGGHEDVMISPSGGRVARAPACCALQRLRDTMNRAQAEVLAIQQRLEQAYDPDHLATLDIQLARARKRQEQAARALRAHVDTHHCR
jgi:hypothetical protein